MIRIDTFEDIIYEVADRFPRKGLDAAELFGASADGGRNQVVLIGGYLD